MSIETKATTVSQMEKDLQEREKEYMSKLVTLGRSVNQLDIEKIKFNKMKKSYDNYVITFVFGVSLLSVVIYRNVNYETVDKYLKTRHPYVHKKVNDFDYDMESLDVFEFTLIVAAYHYIMYKIIVNRFVVMFLCGICGMYMLCNM